MAFSGLHYEAPILRFGQPASPLEFTSNRTWRRFSTAQAREDSNTAVTFFKEITSYITTPSVFRECRYVDRTVLMGLSTVCTLTDQT